MRNMFGYDKETQGHHNNFRPACERLFNKWEKEGEK
jgi:hypothetical protein